jgi:hypothetical protein
MRKFPCTFHEEASLCALIALLAVLPRSTQNEDERIRSFDSHITVNEDGKRRHTRQGAMKDSNPVFRAGAMSAQCAGWD